MQPWTGASVLTCREDEVLLILSEPHKPQWIPPLVPFPSLISLNLGRVGSSISDLHTPAIESPGFL